MIGWISVLVASMALVGGLSYAQKCKVIRGLCITAFIIDLFIIIFAIFFLAWNNFPIDESRSTLIWCFDPENQYCIQFYYSDVLTTISIAIVANCALSLIAFLSRA